MPLPPLSKKGKANDEDEERGGGGKEDGDSYSDDSYSDADFDEDYEEEGEELTRPGSVASSATDDVPFFGDPAYASARSTYLSSASSTPQSSARGGGESTHGYALQQRASINMNRGGIRSRQKVVEHTQQHVNEDEEGLKLTFASMFATGPSTSEQTSAVNKTTTGTNSDTNVPIDVKLTSPLPPRPDRSEVNYESDYSEYDDDDSEFQASEVTQASSRQSETQESMMKESLSLPILVGGTKNEMKSSVSHPVVTAASERLRDTNSFGRYMDSVNRPWIQKRAEQVHSTKSVFSSLGRPVIPGVIQPQHESSRYSIDPNLKETASNVQPGGHFVKRQVNLGGERNRRKKRKKKRNVKKSLSVNSLPSIMESPSRVVPGGNHSSMLATAQRRNEWISTRKNVTTSSVNSKNSKRLQKWVFERLIAIMKVYRLRSKDLFLSLDRDSDGIISVHDMQESLQVLGLNSITRKETKRLVNRIARMHMGNRGLIDFNTFEFALRRSNTKRESLLNYRQGFYVHEQNALAERISASQKTVNELVARSATEMDATLDICDESGRQFWKERFSRHTTSVPLWRLMKELKHELWVKSFGPRHIMGTVGPSSGHMQKKLQASIPRNRPETSPNDRWIFRRVVVLLGGDLKKNVTAMQFGDMLKTFGPMGKLKQNIQFGPLKLSSSKKANTNGKLYTISRGATSVRHML